MRLASFPAAVPWWQPPGPRPHDGRTGEALRRGQKEGKPATSSRRPTSKIPTTCSNAPRKTPARTRSSRRWPKTEGSPIDHRRDRQNRLRQTTLRQCAVLRLSVCGCCRPRAWCAVFKLSMASLYCWHEVLHCRLLEALLARSDCRPCRFVAIGNTVATPGLRS